MILNLALLYQKSDIINLKSHNLSKVKLKLKLSETR
jgi:hypothetical protein